MPRTNDKPSPLRTPLAAGGAAAIVCVLAAAGLSLFGGQEPAAIGARASVPAGQLAEPEPPEAAPVMFAETGTQTEIGLPGVEETETALNPAAPAASQTISASAPAAPLPGLYEPGPGGPLPVISAAGQRPDTAYARAFDGDPDAPTIAVIVGGLGLNRALTTEAIEQLPAEITLSFVPYARDLQDWVDRARADGHEVLIELPMEPFNYPNNDDTGPYTLLAEGSTVENTRRLNWLLSRAAGYTGVINYLGARLGANEDALTRIFTELEGRGLSIFHDGSGRRPAILGAQHASSARLSLVDRLLDADPEARAIDERLLELEALSLQNGNALGMGSPYPTTVDSLASWASSLPARGYQLAPASFLSRVRNAAADDPES